jgi:hypothetical protein
MGARWSQRAASSEQPTGFYESRETGFYESRSRRSTGFYESRNRVLRVTVTVPQSKSRCGIERRLTSLPVSKRPTSWGKRRARQARASAPTCGPGHSLLQASCSPPTAARPPTLTAVSTTTGSTVDRATDRESTELGVPSGSVLQGFLALASQKAPLHPPRRAEP